MLAQSYDVEGNTEIMFECLQIIASKKDFVMESLSAV